MYLYKVTHIPYPSQRAPALLLLKISPHAPADAQSKKQQQQKLVHYN